MHYERTIRQSFKKSCIFGELDSTILESLSDAMGADAQLAPNAGRLARALYLGSAELASWAVSPAEMESELSAFAAAHLAGVRALSRQGERR
jgi:hypothetical protein